MLQLDEKKQKQRATWSAGDYDQIARGIQSVADHVVRNARVRAGEKVLDVACGTGNTALMARARGATVTALDLTAPLLEVARRREAAEGLNGIQWTEGDAEQLPFADGSFDVVLSSCGLMFAPDQQAVAREVARVTRPGGRIGIQAWTRDGGVGRMFTLTSKYLPPPPGASSPFAWGEEAHVRSLFGSTFGDYHFEHYDCPEFTDTPEQLAELFVTKYGPTNRVFHSLAADKAAEFRKELTDFYRSYITPADGKVRWGREYLIAVATRT